MGVRTDVTHRQMAAMLTLIWTDLTLSREQKLTPETITMLGAHFAPDFHAHREPDDTIRYGLDMPHDPERSTVDTIWAMVTPPDIGNKHLRLDVNSTTVREFLETARGLLLKEIAAEFPVVAPKYIESSFAYEAQQLIVHKETDDEDHPPSSD